MKLFGRKDEARKKWHSKAMLIDLHKTKITLIQTKKPKHVPPWIYKKLNCNVSVQIS